MSQRITEHFHQTKFEKLQKKYMTLYTANVECDDVMMTSHAYDGIINYDIMITPSVLTNSWLETFCATLAKVMRALVKFS